jgi:hypothetical protein
LVYIASFQYIWVISSYYNKQPPDKYAKLLNKAAHHEEVVDYYYRDEKV